MAKRDVSTTETAPLHAGIYCRISQDHTGEQLGVTRQREDCMLLVESMGWKVHEIYEDNDISATKGKPRPAYRKMLADIEAGHVHAVVTWAPDRLYRKLRDLEPLIEAFEKHAIVFKTVRGGEFDMGTPLGRMIARILASVSTGEGEVKADRWSRSWRQRRELGEPVSTGSRLFGYTRDNEVIPEEAETARRMAEDIISGVPILAVARWLETEQILATRGNIWRPAGVRTYLANPRIAGYSTMKGEIVGEGQWEPILDRETWETVRALLASRTRTAPPRRSVLNGLLFCGRCGHRMITSGQRGQRTYRCPNRPGLRGCGTISGNAVPIEEVVEEYARVMLLDDRTRARIAELQSVAGASDLAAEVTALGARVLELEAELDQPGVPVTSILRAIDRTKERLGACSQRLAEVTASAMPVTFTGGSVWPEDLADRRRLVAVALGTDKVYLDPLPEGWSNRNGFDPTRVRIGEPRE